MLRPSPDAAGPAHPLAGEPPAHHRVAAGRIPDGYAAKPNSRTDRARSG